MSCHHALTPIRFRGHVIAPFFLNDLPLLSNKGALPLLRADLVHVSEISFHIRAPAFFKVMDLVRDQHIAYTPTFFYVRRVHRHPPEVALRNRSTV